MVRSAPGIPEETRKCFDGLAMSPNSGSCGTAAYTGEMVIVEDTLTDPRWAGLRDLAREIHNPFNAALKEGDRGLALQDVFGKRPEQEATNEQSQY